MKGIGLLLIFVTISVASEKARYDFYRLYEIIPQNEIHLKIFKEMSYYPDGV